MKLSPLKWFFLTASIFFTFTPAHITIAGEQINSTNVQELSSQDTPTAAADNISNVVSPPNLKVDGIMYDKADPMAIVNDQPLRKGDIIEGAKIIEINELEVTFQCNDKTITKTVGEDSKKENRPPRYLKKPKIDLKMDLPAIAAIKNIKSKRELEKVILENIIKIWRILLILFLAAYIYMSAMVHMIANKTGTGYGWMAWIPIINIFLLCMIAEKSFWWVLLFFIPFGPIIFLIMVWGGVAEACGKSWWLGILAVFPVVNFIVAGYLAFSTQTAEV